MKTYAVAMLEAARIKSVSGPLSLDEAKRVFNLHSDCGRPALLIQIRGRGIRIRAACRINRADFARNLTRMYKLRSALREADVIPDPVPAHGRGWGHRDPAT